MSDDAVFDLAITDGLLSTTRAVRKRLDLERPVPEEILTDCLRLAQQAPTGANRQGWSWLIVRDAGLRSRLAELYRRAAGPYLAASGEEARARGAAQDARVFESATYLADVLERVPVHVIPCIDVGHLPEAPPRAAWAGTLGSIFPAVWSFQLALRARGLGSALTTLHLRHEAEAADLLGIPAHVMQCALLPVAYTRGTDFRPAKRPPVETIIHRERW